MAPRTNSEIVAEIMTTEGWPEYGSKPTDSGGPTKGGITLAALSDWLGRPAAVEELQDLTAEVATQIYLEKYVLGPKFDEIEDVLLRYQVVDGGVLSGQGTATRWLQSAVGTSADGRWGPKTAAAVNRHDPHYVATLFAAARIAFLGRLVRDRPKDSANAAGWMSRATSFLRMEAVRYEGQHGAIRLGTLSTPNGG